MIQRILDVEKVAVYESIADRLEAAAVALFGPVPNSDTKGDPSGLESFVGSPQKRRAHSGS